MENKTQEVITNNPENTNPEPVTETAQASEGGQGSTAPAQTIPYERFKEVNEGLKTFKSALSELGLNSVDELKSFAQTAKQLQAQDEERKRAELTDIDRYKADLETANGTIEQLKLQMSQTTEAMKREKITRAFESAARAKGIQYVDDAYQLAKTKVDGLTIGENGEVSGLDDIVNDLVATKPFLVREVENNQPETIGGSSNPPVNSQTEQRSKAEVLKQFADKARKSGRHEDMVAYMAKKKELGI